MSTAVQPALLPLEQIEALYETPLFPLIEKAHRVHQENWAAEEVQLCTLMSIKTGGCSEDCSYCSQSAHYSTGVERETLVGVETVYAVAQQAKETGSTRFCMGAAWKGVRKGDAKFDQVLDIVRRVSDLGMEVCVTLGELGDEEAACLKDAGVTAYNHNLDTSPEHYPNIVSTHTYEDRLSTIGAVQRSGMALCCGGILGLGESRQDRLRFLQVLTGFRPAPESIPINSLMAMPGTPLEDNAPVDVFELVRMIAVTRILFPSTKVRLSAGRTSLSKEGQALCLYAGANSIFYGAKLLTAPNPANQADDSLLEVLGLKKQPSFSNRD